MLSSNFDWTQKVYHIDIKYHHQKLFYLKTHLK